MGSTGCTPLQLQSQTPNCHPIPYRCLEAHSKQHRGSKNKDSQCCNPLLGTAARHNPAQGIWVPQGDAQRTPSHSKQVPGEGAQLPRAAQNVFSICCLITYTFLEMLLHRYFRGIMECHLVCYILHRARPILRYCNFISSISYAAHRKAS